MYLPFFTSPNLADTRLTESCPWDFGVDEQTLAGVRAKPKATRRQWLLSVKTQWNIYTPIRGMAKNFRVSKDNPAYGVRGIVADYDMRSSIQEVLGHLDQMPQQFQPNFIDVSLSQKVRLVWCFEKEILVPSPEFCTELLHLFAEELGLPVLLAGYDDASEKSTQVWTNGGQWFDVKTTPLSWEVCFGVLCKASKKSKTFGKTDIPLEIIADEVTKRFPGRWQGEFKVENLGVRFWDEKADNTQGCQIKPDGMLCFTGPVPFMTWTEIFGNAWTEEQRVLNLGKAGDGLFFDGKWYWEMVNSRWSPSARSDIVLRLKNRGLSDKSAKHETVSEVDRVLNHIQILNRVEGAAPMINYRPGLVEVNGRRVLNVSSIRPYLPAQTITGDPNTDFPWLWGFLQGHFARPELHPLDYFLTWLRRAYISSYEYRRLMGQAVFLCGPAHNGKTLTCLHIVSPLLGGRIANPFEYFVGETGFNDELFEAGLWAINDEEAPRSEQSRQKFLSRIKASVVNPVHTYHPKFCAKVSVDWIGRVLITLNDDANSVGVLPEVSYVTRDKMHFFASQPYKGQWDENSVTESRIAAELPLFARWLLDVYKPPEFVIDNNNRCGMKSFFDPIVLDLSRQQANAYNLHELITIWVQAGVYWQDAGLSTWVGTPTDLFVQFSLSDHLAPIMRDWTVGKVAKCLTTLARLDGSGIKFTEGDADRSFTISREAPAKNEALPH